MEKEVQATMEPWNAQPPNVHFGVTASRFDSKCVQHMLPPTEQDYYGSLPNVHITSAVTYCRNGSVCRDVLDNRSRMPLVTTNPIFELSTEDSLQY